jgi:hypothetical protein
MQNNIDLLILPPHTSHVTQPLDIAIFGPLKRHIATAFATYSEAGVHRVKKHEWATTYAIAHELAFTEANIASGWRGSGLLPFQPNRVLREHALATRDTLLERPSTPTGSQFEILDSVFQNSSPPLLNTLQKANATLSEFLNSQAEYPSPVKRYIRRLGPATERLHT